jgi:hypothetical protein
LRLNVSVFDPPRKVGVAPTTTPEEDATVMLWLSGAMLVKAMETLPALAVSDALLYFSWPSGLASRLNGGAALAGAGAVDATEVGLVGDAGRTFGLAAGGLAAGVGDVAALDVAGLTGWLAGVDAVGLGVGADVVTVLDVVGTVLDVVGTVLDAVGVLATLAAVDVGGVVLLADSPQPASAIRPTASVSVVSLDNERGVALSTALNLMVKP